MRALLLSLMALGLSACAATADRHSGGAEDRQRIARAVDTQRWSEAEAPLARLLQRDLRNGPLQFLHAMALEQQALAGDRSGLEQAAVGFESALRFAPGHYASLLRLGVIALEQGQHLEAQQRFAEAVLMRHPDADTLRQTVVARWGRRALVSLAFGLLSARLYPTLKYALGHAHTCVRVQVAGEALAVAGHA